MSPELAHHISTFIQAKHAAGRLESTLAYYEDVLGEFKQFAEWPPTPAHVRAYLSHKRENCSEATLDSVFHGVRAFLNWCDQQELLPQNPLDRLDRPKKPRRLPKAVSVETMRRLFKSIRDHLKSDDLATRDHALFRLAYDTGARASELAGLLLVDLELEDNSILIRGGKGRQDRKVYFGPKCVRTLQAWLELHPGGRRLFLNVLGNPLTRNGIYQALQKWCDRAAIQMTVHQIRHSYATHSIRRGIELDIIQRQMGHADITTTAIYLAVEDAERRAAYRLKAPGDVV
ncbi:MAG: tyrosine recombinase XerC [Chloroflexota bacterium]|nr:MAG: tyrosine recombinase XerC [Chloroflexota bacterium]